MTFKPFILASTLTLIAASAPVSAEPAAGAHVTAAVAVLPAATAAAQAAQPLEDVVVEAGPAPEMTPAQRRAANRKAREELRRRLGPSIHIFN